jgi:hypothetical protein
MLRHPGIAAGVLFFLAPWAISWGTGDAMTSHPVLQDTSRTVQAAALLLGAAALLVANLAVLRSSRGGTEEQLGTLVLTPRQRTAGHLLALLPLGLLAALLAGAVAAALAALPAAAGRTDYWELAAVPVLVVLLGAAGVLLGSLWRSMVVAPLVLVMLAVGVMLTLVNTSESRWWWLIAVEQGSPLPVALMSRPSAMHLLYLLALAVLLGLLALLRHAPRPPLPAVAAGLAAVGVLAAGIAQSGLPSGELENRRVAYTERAGEFQDCRKLHGVRYCAFPEFDSWVGEWDRLVRAVRTGMPEAAARRPGLTVRQRVLAAAEFRVNATSGAASGATQPLPWPNDGAVSAGLGWGSGDDEAAMAVEVALHAVTGKPLRNTDTQVCEAQALLVAWLAASASPKAGEGYRTALDSSWNASVLPGPVNSQQTVMMPDREAEMVRKLLDRPRAETRAKFKAAWPLLVRPGTTTEQAAKRLGITAPPPPKGEQGMCGR